MDGGHAGDQAKGGIGLTALRGRKEIAQPGHHRRGTRGRGRDWSRESPRGPRQGGRQRERDQPGHRQGAPTRIQGLRRPQRVHVWSLRTPAQGWTTILRMLSQVMIKNARLGASANPTSGAWETRGVVPQRMPRLEQHGHKRVKDQPGQGRRLGNQAEEQRATPAEGLHAGASTPRHVRHKMALK